VLAGVNVIREPDKVAITELGAKSLDLEKDVTLTPGTVVLRYGLHSDGDWDLWTSGIWYTATDEIFQEKGSFCEFVGGECDYVVVNNGRHEWWVQVKTASGHTGWVLAAKLIHERSWRDSSFSELCTLD